jgi:Hemolysin-type calcium-binding repeat (2 copies).
VTTSSTAWSATTSSTGTAANDTIIGGYGADWISGGTGDDGILGDDGRLFASRVGTAEPLYGIAVDPAAQQNLLISNQGNAQQAIINVVGALRYTADLTPDNLIVGDPSPTTAQETSNRPCTRTTSSIGGLGNDSIHGGAGDDAILGAEAPISGYADTYNQAGTQTNTAPVETDFSHPYNSGNLLGYNPTTTKFAQYDANDPLREVFLNATNGSLDKTGTGRNWFLNFDSTEGPTDTYWVSGQTTYAGVATDGDDVIFGDLGHDWAVGGTGRDQLFGGWGDDLLNVDDKLSAVVSTSQVPDTNPS